MKILNSLKRYGMNKLFLDDLDLSPHDLENLISSSTETTCEKLLLHMIQISLYYLKDAWKMFLEMSSIL